MRVAQGRNGNPARPRWGYLCAGRARRVRSASCTSGFTSPSFSAVSRCRYNRGRISSEKQMAIDVYWGSGSPYSWRVLLALEYKRLAYTSHVLQFSKQEHQSPQMLALNWRGKVPVLKDGDYVCFESLAVLYYLDLKYPEPPIFGRTPEEAGVIMRVICEYQAYIEPHLITILNAVFGKQRLDAGRGAGAGRRAAGGARAGGARRAK